MGSLRIDAVPCKADGSCKRNCKANPKCLRHLGEKKWREMAHGSGKRKKTAASEDNSCKKIREAGVPAGLVNLGATCYVNSLLQIWFHNTTLREAVYRWRPKGVSPGATSCDNQRSLQQNEVVMTEIQRVFACLGGTKSYAQNPVKFIDALALSHTVQQDGQEFARLFMNILEQELPVPRGTGSIVGSEYGGTYTYITKCLTCRTQSSRSSPFYELELQTKGKGNLAACIAEYFAPEPLNGTNQYACSTCNTKRDAVRELRIVELPKVLSFHLLRFDYDLAKGTKTKIKDILTFPETLTMAPYHDSDFLTTGGEAPIYDLEAILIHRGPSASSGHYGAQLRVPTPDVPASVWWEFDDDMVRKVPVSVGAAGLRQPCLGELSVADPRCKAISKVEKQKAAAAAKNSTAATRTASEFDAGDNDGGSASPTNKRRRTSEATEAPSAPGVAPGGGSKDIAPVSPLHFSKNVYMLTYRSRGRHDHANDGYALGSDGRMRNPPAPTHVLSDHTYCIPHHLRDEIATANAKLVETVEDERRASQQRAQDETQRSTNVLEQYTALCPSPSHLQPRPQPRPHATDTPDALFATEDDDGDAASAQADKSAPGNQALQWVPTVWVEAWLKQALEGGAGGQVPDVDNRQHLCMHGRLDPLKVRANKLVDAETLQQLLAPTDRTHFTPLDGTTGCCTACVQSLFAEVQHRVLFEALQKQLKALGAFGGRRFVTPTEGYFVAKAALRSLSQKLPPNIRGRGWRAASDADEIFNNAARCEHGNRSINEQHVTIVSHAVWDLIEAFFGSSNVVSMATDTALCGQCLHFEHGEAVARRSQKEEAVREKEILPSMFQLATGRPDVTHLVTGEAARLYVLPTEFTFVWRQWCKSRTPRSDRPRPTGINFSPLLCTCGSNHVLIHVGNLLRHAGVDGSGSVPPSAETHAQQKSRMVFPCAAGTRWRSRDFFELVTEAEWAVLAALYPDTSPVDAIYLDGPGTATATATNGVADTATSNGAVTPGEHCPMRGAPITRAPVSAPANTNGTADRATSTPTAHTLPVRCNRAFSQACFKTHLAIQNAGVTYKGATLWVRSRAAGTDAASPRGSSVRQRRSRGGCKKLIVDSTDSLRELRVKIMNVYNVMPSDQHIFWRGQEIVDTAATLAFLGIGEHDEIEVAVDSTVVDDLSEGSRDALETGFYGTLLSSSSAPTAHASTTATPPVAATPPPIVIDDDAVSPEATLYRSDSGNGATDEVDGSDVEEDVAMVKVGPPAVVLRTVVPDSEEHREYGSARDARSKRM